MNIDFLQDIGSKFENSVSEIFRKTNIEGIGKEEVELAEKLGVIEEFSIDRFEGNIAVLENRINGEKRNVEKNKLPKDISEGSIVKCINGKYFSEEELTKNERDNIMHQMNNLWN